MTTTIRVQLAKAERLYAKMAASDQPREVLRTALQAAYDLGAEEHYLPMDCPSCERGRLLYDRGTGTIQCEKCRILYSDDDPESRSTDRGSHES